MIPWPADEAQVLQAAARGDADAFRLLTERWRPELRARCLRILGNPADADDAVQETLMRAWTRLTTIRSSATVRGWLHVIATTTSLNMAKQGRRRSAAPLEAAPEPAGPGADDVAHDQQQLRDALSFAVGRLPPRQRAALLLREGLAWTPSEIAALFGDTTASVNSALQRARATLGSAAAPEGSPDDLRTAVLGAYLEAWEATDVERLVGIARADAKRAPLLERVDPHGGGWMYLGPDGALEFRPAFMR